MSELLDFTGRKDFEDLKFGKGYHLTQDDISVFKEDCRRINTIHNQMALEQCKIGLLLSELKAGKTWQSVINPKTGFAYLVHSFEDFCKDVFGFSGTKTYALMQIAKFVTSNSENEVHFIDEKYSKFSSSQLTELASVPTYKRHFFTADMTIEQMRFVKKYIETDEFLEDRQKEDFDLLTYANNYVESKKKPKALPASKPDVLPGQQSIFPEENDDGESEISPTSGKSEPGEEIDEYEEDKNSPEYQEYIKECEPWIELTDEKREKAIKIALVERVGEIKKRRIYDKYKSTPLHGEFVNFLKEEYGNSGWGVGALQGSCDYKGYRIKPDRGEWVIFMTWSQVASRIVGLINTGEYLDEYDVEMIHEEEKLAEEIEKKYIPERDEYEPNEDEVWQGGGLDHDVDEYDEADEAQEDMHAEMETIEADAEESVSETPRVDFSSRAKIREFLSGFQKWGRRFCAYPLEFMSVYYHSFRNNKAILAVLSPGCNDMEKMASDHSTVRYYWKNELNGKYFEVTTRELERVIPLIKDEL